MKMGSAEKSILEVALYKDSHGSSLSPSSSMEKDTLKRLVRKNWLHRIDIGEFEITEKGKQALKKRRDTEDEGQQALGHFS